MIEASDAFLVSWAESVLDGVEVGLELPDDSGDDPEDLYVSLHLLRLDLPSHNLRGDALEHTVRLDYLVTVSGPDLAESHRRLGELLMSAAQHADIEVDCTPPSAEMWMALGLFPRPCFWLGTSALHVIEQPAAPLVRSPIAVHTRPMATLHGVVLGPEDQGVAGAGIRIGTSGSLVRSDRNGRFTIYVPAGPRNAAAGTWPVLEVRARGNTMRVRVPDEIYSSADPFVIQFNPMEA